MDSNFHIKPLSEHLKEDMIKKNIWSSSCPVGLESLVNLHLSYINFDNEIKHDGELIVHIAAASHVLSIFKSLYQNKFPIAKIKLISDYNGDDEKSMEDNNTSAFNYRKIVNTEDLSIHSYGLAIDINPLQNPYLLNDYNEEKNSIPTYPSKGMEYINRLNIRPGMVETVLNNKQTVIDIFNAHGFLTWGGSWNNPVDWHHFQTTRKQAEYISKLSNTEAIEYFNTLIL